MKHGSPETAILLTVVLLTACGGGDIANLGPTAPTALSTPTPTPCSSMPGPEANVFPDRAFPSADQEKACSGNVRPRIEDLVATRRDQGVEIGFNTVDSDALYSCSSKYFNGTWRGGSCGGVGRGGFFSNFLTFPVHVRVVAWDDRGCLAVPACLVVQ